MAYYGSDLADRAVAHYYKKCERTGFQYDEPGRNGVDIKRSRGTEVIIIRNRYGGVEAMYDEAPDGRLREIEILLRPH